MAYKNRNRQDQYRSNRNDWNEDDRNRRRGYDEDEPNYSSSENRGYSSRSYGSQNYGSQDNDSGWESRYERQQRNENHGGSYGGGNSGNYGRQWESDYNEGTAGRGYTSGYSDFGGSYGSRSEGRNLYDRGYQGMDRSDFENRGNRLGAGNYGRYGDRGRFDQNQQYGGFGGSSYGGNYGGSSYRDRGYGTNTPEDRSWWDRTTDEVSSWFGDEEAERRRERDRSHRGKGPKNYSRSDDRIKEDVNDRLSDDPYIDASEIEVSVSNGEVTLTGTVEHRSTKRRAEDLAEDVSGVKHVENRLRVSKTSTSGMSTPSGTSGSLSSSPVSGSERSRNKENSYATSK